MDNTIEFLLTFENDFGLLNLNSVLNKLESYCNCNNINISDYDYSISPFGRNNKYKVELKKKLTSEEKKIIRQNIVKELDEINLWFNNRLNPLPSIFFNKNIFKSQI
jgi:hypothetical protein